MTQRPGATCCVGCAHAIDEEPLTLAVRSADDSEKTFVSGYIPSA
jgi:hypothetical protein